MPELYRSRTFPGKWKVLRRWSKGDEFKGPVHLNGTGTQCSSMMCGDYILQNEQEKMLAVSESTFSSWFEEIGEAKPVSTRKILNKK